MTSPERIHLASVLSEDLAMRVSAAELFDTAEKLPGDAVEMDFEGVKSCTRSFADEYSQRKRVSSKSIIEVNMPIFVHQLMMAVAHPKNKDQVIDIDNLNVTVL